MASIDEMAAQPNAVPNHLIAPSTQVTPMKRKHSPSPSQNDDEEHEQAVSPQSQSAEPAAHISAHPQLYGVYQHNLLTSPDKADTKLITTSTTHANAYNAMRDHARNLIDANPRWGATSEHTTHKTYDIIDSQQQTQLRYDIVLIHCTSTDENGTPIYQRGAPPIAAPRHYGVYFSLHRERNGKVHITGHFAGGYTCLAEASQAMSMAARAYLAEHSGSRVQERSIELLDGAGRVGQRHWIEEGRLVDGVFVKEEEWEGTSDQRGDGGHGPVGKGKKHSVLRMPTPEMGVGETTSGEGEARFVGNQVPRPPLEASGGEDGGLTDRWCTCRQADDGTTMVGCDNEGCSIGWYHCRCLGLEMAPEGEWWCPLCESGRKAVKKTVVEKTAVKKAAVKKATVKKPAAKESAATKPTATNPTATKNSKGKGGVKKRKTN